MSSFLTAFSLMPINCSQLLYPILILRLYLSASQEVLFNVMACTGYASASTYLAWTTMVWLYPRFVTTRGYMAYPMMTVVYVSMN